MINKTKVWIVALALILFTTMGYSSIRVSTLRLDFLYGQPKFQDILVTNQGKKTAYVKVEVFKRPEPIKDPSKLVQLHGQPKEFGLLATPSKLAIPAQQIRRVRVISLVQGNKKDVVYAVKISPVKSPLKTIAATTDGIRGGIQLTTTYQIGVYIRPPHAKAALKIERKGKEVIITNTGNTNTLLGNFKQCESKDKCTNVKAVKRLYAKQSYHVELPKAEPVEFQSFYLDGIQQHKSN